MRPEKIKVVWLAPYPVTRLQPSIVIRRQPKLEHPATWIVNLADALALQDDIELHVVAASAAVSESRSVRVSGVDFHVVRHAIPFTCRGFPAYLRLDLWTRYAALRWQIGNLVRSLQPDLIHAHGTEAGYGLAALDADCPTIVSIQGVVNLLAQLSPSIAFRLQAGMERQVIRQTRFFGSRTQWANDYIMGVNPSAIIFDLSEAIAEVFFQIAERESNEPTILIVGSTTKAKGMEEAVAAMPLVAAACPGVKLLVAGTGPADYQSALRRRATSTGVDGNIDWLGQQTTPEIAALHARSTLLIHPSHLDNSPNSVAEAMASGLPVIASNVGGLPSMVEHEETGILVEPHNHARLAAAIIALLRNPGERRRLATNARRIARERHLPSNVAAQTTRVYRRIIADSMQQTGARAPV